MQAHMNSNLPYVRFECAIEKGRSRHVLLACAAEYRPTVVRICTLIGAVQPIHVALGATSGYTAAWCGTGVPARSSLQKYITYARMLSNLVSLFASTCLFDTTSAAHPVFDLLTLTTNTTRLALHRQ